MLEDLYDVGYQWGSDGPIMHRVQPHQHWRLRFPDGREDTDKYRNDLLDRYDLNPNTAWPLSHYRWLDEYFQGIVERLALEPEPRRAWGNFSADGDKYYSYKDTWAREGILWFHGAAMYHLMVTYFHREIRDTPNGWVKPDQWVIDNYRGGHNLARGMEDL